MFDEAYEQARREMPLPREVDGIHYSNTNKAVLQRTGPLSVRSNYAVSPQAASNKLASMVDDAVLRLGLHALCFAVA